MSLKPLDICVPTQAGSTLSWTGLSGAELSLAIAETAQRTNQPLLLLAPTSGAALQLIEELRFFGMAAADIRFFNDWETLPYDHFSPHPDIVSERLHQLQQLSLQTHGITVIAATTLLQRLAPAHYIEAHSLVVKCGDAVDIAALRQRFARCGYQQVEQVLQHGEFAMRGSILDVFPMGSYTPFRIDFFDNEVDSIRIFDLETQRSLEKIPQINLLPAREFPLDEAGIARFRQAWRAEFEGNPANCPLYQDISQGIASNGIEYYLPLFFEQTQSLCEYLPQNAIVISLVDLPTLLQRYWQEINERYQQLRHDNTRPLLAPEKAFFTPEVIAQQLQSLRCIQNQPAVDPPLHIVNPKSREPYAALKQTIIAAKKPVLFTAESLGHRERLLEQFASAQLYPSVCNDWAECTTSQEPLRISIAKLRTGCELDSLLIISEAQITGQTPEAQKRQNATTQDVNNIIRNLTELRIGEPVVHIDHGLGRYLGLQTLTVNNQTSEFVTLEYADQTKLYVPVTNLHLISRYGSMEAEKVALNKLGTEQWQKAREKAAKRAHDVAAELLAIHAERANKPGFQFNTPDEQYQQFAAHFPFELTADQVAAISQIITDMSSERAMDRLVCGDVGFGKTEVAMRAAFLAVQSGKQVAVLVPTTLLAQQHYETFKERFAETATQIAVLSRFNSGKQQEKALADLEAGKVDIIIGTHKLIQSDVKFYNLGLLIIDEEHRFGVRQKERLKALRAEVDILTLTATPIPRTLNMALSDVRDLSIIGTPPAKRLAVKTFVHEYAGSVVREALLREIMRGGQAFYLHNSIDTIEQRCRELQQLMPEAKVQAAHGQMPEAHLEKIMADFYHQRFNVLVCTTIIENGIDIPTANTIVIERADKLGLAQLHQLRGRVGRSHHQAYAYLLTPHANLLTRDAEKRLEAISQLEDLGIGFALATHDLEIRGAGEFLGDEQSGHIQTVGFSLYMEFLERAVESLKAGVTFNFSQPLPHSTEVDLQIPALIPENYLPDVHMRLILYKRIASAKTNDELRALETEMIDRFGLLPEPTKHLFAVTQLKLQAEPLGIRKISANKETVYLDFLAQPNIDPLQIIQLIQKQPKQYKMEGSSRLRVTLPDKTKMAERLATLLSSLAIRQK